MSKAYPERSCIPSAAQGRRANSPSRPQPNSTPSSPSGEKPPPPEDETGSSYSPPELSYELLKDILSLQGSSMSGELSFQDEIVALRDSLHCLQESFSKVDSIGEQLKLTSAINHTTASLTRLVRTQHFIRANQPSAFDQIVDEALTEVLKDWDGV